jgi:hypothetical protein
MNRGSSKGSSLGLRLEVRLARGVVSSHACDKAGADEGGGCEATGQY